MLLVLTVLQRGKTLRNLGRPPLADNSAMSNPSLSPEPLAIRWDSRFHTLGPAFFSQVAPQGMPEPYWVAQSSQAAELLSWGREELAQEEMLQALAGNSLLEDAQPIASVYSGHQFGHWAGQLGDGRAILMGETQGYEIQLKGCGLTPYSRMGDGRAVLRSSIREYLASEAMAALGIPTTRALCIVGSDLPVRRESMETAAVVTRLSPSFIRFGHFEHFAARDQLQPLRQLADFVIAQYYPSCQSPTHPEANPYSDLLAAVVVKTAELIAHWQAIGFCHGVMNTDNMSILGLTLDYGPFQFMDAYDPAHICNHSDDQGRYAFMRQPDIANWNLFCLGQALMPLIEDSELALSALHRFPAVYQAKYISLMMQKLGLGDTTPIEAPLSDTQQDDLNLLKELLPLLAHQKVDYTIFWRRLSNAALENDWALLRDLFIDRDAADPWLARYRERLGSGPVGSAQQALLAANPKFVLRNHMAEQAIEAAQRKDFSVLASLQAVLAQPFDEHPAYGSWADFPPDWAANISVSCSS